jgi:hypothetical protein
MRRPLQARPVIARSTLNPREQHSRGDRRIELGPQDREPEAPIACGPEAYFCWQFWLGRTHRIECAVARLGM